MSKEDAYIETFIWGTGRMPMVEFISSGSSSYAYLGADRKVYIVTSVATDETSKPWLARYIKDQNLKPIHLPQVEFLGVTSLGGADWLLTRMPFYQALDDALDPAKLAVVENIVDKFAQDPHYVEDLVVKGMDAGLLRDQLKAMLKEMEGFEDYMFHQDKEADGLYRDWSIYNLGLDAKGRLVNYDPYNTDIPYFRE